jgi:hypothetical protein
MTERLYPLAPTPAVDAAEGHFEPQDDGGFDFPPDLAARLHASRFGRRKLWETSVERQERTYGEDLARRRDPAVALDALERIGSVLGRVADSAAPHGAPQDSEAEIAALRARLAELEDRARIDAEDGAAEDGAGAGQKPAAKRGTGASKAAPAA